MEKIQEVLAENLVHFRKLRGFTQTSLAEAAGMTLRGIQQIEYKLRWPKPGNLSEIAKVLGVQPSDLLLDERARAQVVPAPPPSQQAAAQPAPAIPSGSIPADLLYFQARLAKEDPAGLERLRVLAAGMLKVKVTPTDKPKRRPRAK